MPDTRITFENPSKRSLVGHPQDQIERDTALRDLIARNARDRLPGRTVWEREHETANISPRS